MDRQNPPVTTRRVAIAVAAGLVASAIGIAIGLTINWFPAEASSKAHVIDTLYNVLIVASVPMFVLVAGVVIFSVLHFRMRPGQEDLDGPPIHGNTRLEVVWTALPAIMLVSLCSYAYVALRDFEKESPNALDVNVGSQQFAWSFQYPSSVTGGAPQGSTELYLPVNRPAVFHVTSVDVIHAFYVPAFRLQTDAVPGQTDVVRATPTRLGTYPIVCAELCGLGHSTMRSTVHVVTADDFKKWLSAKGGPAAPSGDAAALAAAGKQIFTGSGGCSACHTLADANATGTVGPDLAKTLTPDSKTRGLARDAFIRESIVSPNAFISPGYPASVMPQNFGSTLSKSQVDALVAYLMKVTK